MDIRANIKGVQHIGIPTNDIRKTISFYEGIGFEVVYQTVNKAADEAVAFLQQGNLVMEVYENRKAVLSSGAIDHVALDVTDIDAVFSAIQAAGYELVDDCVRFLPFWEHGVKFFTIIGPNREKIEFCERLKKDK